MSQEAMDRYNETPRLRLFVWCSTKNSVRDGIPSALAALEVFVAVAAYWALAIYFDTYTHIWVSICVAPLLLLRSEPSIALGVSWFSSYMYQPEKAALVQRGIALFIGLIVAILVSHFLALHWLAGHDGSAAFWRGTAVGFLACQFGLVGSLAIAGPRSGITAGSIAGGLAGTFVVLFIGGVAGGLGAAVAATSLTLVLAIATRPTPPEVVLLMLPAVPAIAFGIWITTVSIRLVATACHLLSGFWNIPKNFFQNLFVIDFRVPAELVPGYRDIRELRSDGLLRAIRQSDMWSLRLMNLFIFPFFFIPAYAYRLSIKSTCWLYLPLVYIASDIDFSFSPAHLLARLGRTPKEWLRRLLALATLGGFIFITLGAGFIAEPSEFLAAKFVSPLEFLFLINFHSVKPWQIFNLLGAVITIYLFFAAGDVRVDHDYARDKQSQASLTRKVQWLKILMRTRNVSSAILVLILGIHVLLLFSPLATYLPTFILSGLRWFYGEYMPNMPQAH
jgi:hypothetical protein